MKRTMNRDRRRERRSTMAQLVANGVPIREIADGFNVTHYTVRRACIDANTIIPKQPRLTKDACLLLSDRNISLIQERRTGLSYRQLGVKFGITSARIGQIVSEYAPDLLRVKLTNVQKREHSLKRAKKDKILEIIKDQNITGDEIAKLINVSRDSFRIYLRELRLEQPAIIEINKWIESEKLRSNAKRKAMWATEEFRANVMAGRHRVGMYGKLKITQRELWKNPEYRARNLGTRARNKAKLREETNGN